MWSTSQDESQSKQLLHPDVLRVERDFMEVVYPNVTENEKNRPWNQSRWYKMWWVWSEKYGEVCRLTQIEGIKWLSLIKINPFRLILTNSSKNGQNNFIQQMNITEK